MSRLRSAAPTGACWPPSTSTGDARQFAPRAADQAVGAGRLPRALPALPGRPPALDSRAAAAGAAQRGHGQRAAAGPHVRPRRPARQSRRRAAPRCGRTPASCRTPSSATDSRPRTRPTQQRFRRACAARSVRTTSSLPFRTIWGSRRRQPARAAAPLIGLLPTRSAASPGCAGRRGAARRWPRAAAQFLRKPGLPGVPGRRQAVVAKFYRPGRWTDAQILEEHAFALELAAAEVPVVPPAGAAWRPRLRKGCLLGDPPTLACCTAPRTAPTALRWPMRCAGREPELEAGRPRCASSGASSAGCMPWAGGKPFQHRPPDGRACRRPARPDAAAGQRLCHRRRAPAWQTGLPSGRWSLAQAFLRAGSRWPAAPARRLPPGQRAVARRRPARTWWTWTTRCKARRCRTSGCWCPATGSRWPAARSAAGRLRTVLRLRRPSATADRAAAHTAHAAPQRLAGRALERPDLPAELPALRTQAYWSQQTAQLREQLELMAESL
jgi:hypothetical protein